MHSSQSGWETRLGKEQKVGESWAAESQTFWGAVLGRGGFLGLSFPKHLPSYYKPKQRKLDCTGYSHTTT